MTDTRRTYADIIANLIQDGQSEGISAQDLRDIVKSLRPAHGDLHVASGDSAATTIAVAGTFVKAEGTTTLMTDAIDVDANSVNNRLRYTGPCVIHAHVHGQVSLTCTQNNRILAIAMYIYDASAGSGAIQYKGKAREKIGTGTDVVTIPIHTDVELDTNDYVELWVTDEDGTNVITMDQLYICLRGELA